MIIMTTDFVGSCRYVDSISKHFELLMKSMHVDAEQQMWSNVQGNIQRAIQRHADIYEYMFSIFQFDVSPFDMPFQSFKQDLSIGGRHK